MQRGGLNARDAAAQPPAAAAATLCHPPPPASLLLRRGKQQLALFADRCVVKTTKADLTVPYAAIKHVAVRPVGCWMLGRSLGGASLRPGCLPWGQAVGVTPCVLSCRACCPCLQIIDSIPGDTKGKVLLFIHIDRWVLRWAGRDAATASCCQLSRTCAALDVTM